MKIYLVGFMGVGKSTIGKSLAEKLSYTFYDTDSMIVAEENMSISDLFSTKGENYFRKREAMILKKVSKRNKAVISTGGGLACHSNLMHYMNEKGKTIHLKKVQDVLIGELFKGRGSRPLLKDQTKLTIRRFVRKLYAKRRSIYNLADLVVYNNKSIDIVTNRIIDKLNRM